MKATKKSTLFSTKLLVPFTFVLLLMTGTFAFAQERENVNDTNLQGFEEWDTDTDRQLNQNEFNSLIGDVGLYGDWDTNYDGIYDDDELYTGFLNDWDANNDGMISKEEYASGNSEWAREYGDSFDDWDQNDDNYLDLEEYATAMNQTGVFGDWDSDQDGAYNETELHNGLFNSYDMNEDGYINENEFTETGLNSDLNEVNEK